MERSKLEELARSALGGDSRAMERLLGGLRPLVCRWALVWTGSPDAAEDIAQKVLVRVHRSLEAFDLSGPVTTWVYRITRNAMIDGGRSERRERTARDRIGMERLADAVRPGGGSIEARQLLDRMMRSLSPRQRAVLDLVELQGFEAGEVARMLDLSPATVRVHLHRAKEALRTGLRAVDENEEAGHG